jgi:predicted KAP-like P-loop ATPase
MIQAIKAVADFPNIVYVLALDPVIASNAIERVLGVPGSTYLGKV